jgi:hypothetical protein
VRYGTDEYRAWQREYRRKRTAILNAQGLNSHGKSIKVQRGPRKPTVDDNRLDLIAMRDPEIAKGRTNDLRAI